MRKLKAPRLTVKAKTGLVLLFIILLTSVLAPVLAPYDPLVSNLSEALQKPVGCAPFRHPIISAGTP